MKNKISIICLNCFGSPLSVNWKIRYKLITNELQKIDPDLICLQEVFTYKQRKTLYDALSVRYNIFYDDFFGFCKGGLVSFVKKEINVNNYRFEEYLNQGSFLTLAITDRISRKGIQSFKLNINGRDFCLVNTHLLCTYGNYKSDLLQHSLQILQLTKSILETHLNLILCGDLNVSPTNQLLTELKSKNNLVEYLDTTSITVSPTNLNRGVLLNYYGEKKPYRTDYVFATKSLEVVTQEIVFKDIMKYNNKEYNLSDHYGIFTELKL